MSPTATCAVCGRTILDGERVHAYVSVGGSHDVCPLCAPRAADAGWVPADQVDAPALPQPPKRGLLDRVLGRRRDDGGEVEEDFEAPPEPAEVAPEPPAPVADTDLAEQRERPDPAGPGMRSRSRPLDDAAAELSPSSRFERAILRFNVSAAGRTVAGLTRTLGPPSVSVGASATGAGDVRITVAWELTWYQWGVDLDDELRPVFEIAKGFEIAELDPSSRQWNATAIDGGQVVMGAPERSAAPGTDRGDAVRR